MNKLDYQARGAARRGRPWPLWLRAFVYTLAFVCIAVPLTWFLFLGLLWWSSLPG